MKSKSADHYERWLAKLRKRAQPSGAVSQWALALTHQQGGDAEIWRDHLREILEGEEKATLDLILDLDLITAPAKKPGEDKEQRQLW